MTKSLRAATQIMSALIARRVRQLGAYESLCLFLFQCVALDNCWLRAQLAVFLFLYWTGEKFQCWVQLEYTIACGYVVQPHLNIYGFQFLWLALQMLWSMFYGDKIGTYGAVTYA